MEKQLFRLSLLLAVLTVVGLAGLNTGLDPRNVGIVSAHVVQIIAEGEGANGSLQFTINGDEGCPNNLLGDESCSADVTITNTGEAIVTLEAPDTDESGVLETCTGDDPANPGTGGNNLHTGISNLSYTPNVSQVEPGETVSFRVQVTLDGAVTNGCQGKTGEVSVLIVANSIDEDEEEPEEPGPAAVATATPVNEVQGTQATAVPSLTATPAATFTAEVLPSRFPSTGQGGLSEDAANLVQLVLLGTGLAAIGLFLIALGRHRASKDRS